jgi:hypothetical protein
MRTFTLLRRRQPIATYSEPTGLLSLGDAQGVDESGDRGAEAPGEDESHGESHLATSYGLYEAGEDLRGANAVFGLIGSSVTDEDGAAQRSRDSRDADNAAMTGARDVIQTLHEQYCRALDDPQASLAGNWAAQWATPVAGDPSMDAREDHPRRQESSTGRESADMGSTEALLSGARVLKDVFGPMAESDMSGVAWLTDTEPVPEILRLFAPAEYHAAASRRPAALPPALARREHHALGIDSPMSPMPAPAQNPHHDAP